MAKYEDDDEDVVDDEIESSRIISVLAETNRRDRWTVSPSTSMFTVLARSYFDFRKVEAAGDTVELNIVCVFGNVTLVVPEGTKVQLSGFSFLASANSDVVDAPDTPSSLPKLVVNATTVFGRISVRTPNAQDLAAATVLDTVVAGTDAAQAPAPAHAAGAASAWDALPPVDDATANDATNVAATATADEASSDANDAPVARDAETVGAA